jgi:hypothetical protein
MLKKCPGINIENIIDNIIKQPTQTDKDYIKTIITNPNEVVVFYEN